MLLTAEQLTMYKEQLKGIATMKESFNTLHELAIALYDEIAKTEDESKEKRELLEALIMNVAVIHSAATQTSALDECLTHNILWLAQHEYVTPEQAEQIKDEMMSPMEKMLQKMQAQFEEQLESGELADQLASGAAVIPLHPGLEVELSPVDDIPADKVN